MSDADDLAALKARHAQVLAIAERKLDPETLAIIRSALEADHRMRVIRDAFIEGRDHEAVHMIRELDPVGPRALLPMSASDAIILPGQSCQITARPQLPFQPTHLLVSSRCQDFLINDIKVGNRSEFVQAGEVPADLFGVEAPELEAAMAASQDNEDGTSPVYELTVKAKVGRVGIALGLPIVRVGWDVVIIVTNDGQAPMSFRACWLGHVRWTEMPTLAPRPATFPVPAAVAQAHVDAWNQIVGGPTAFDPPGPPPETPPGDQEP